jgi:SAM-dependent methyltransferase
MPEERTRDDIAFLERVLPAPPARVLDVACGLGRHMTELAARGYVCVGVEQDPEISSEAREHGLDVRTLDMRSLHQIEDPFDAVISMWASFGYFDDDTNAAVLAAMADILKLNGGVLVLELQNPAYYAARQGTRKIRPGVVETTSVLDGRLYVEHDYGARFEWRLYEAAEVVALLPSFTLADVEVSADAPRQRLVFHASPASSGASAASPTTRAATVR